MLVIRIEFWPCGRRAMAKSVGTIEIINDGTGSRNLDGEMEFGNYEIRLYRCGGRGVWKSLRIEGFPRLRLNAWHLLRQALCDAFPLAKDEMIVETVTSGPCPKCGMPVIDRGFVDAAKRVWHYACAQESLSEGAKL